MLKHRPAESTDTRRFIIDSAAIVAGNHAGLCPAEVENMRAEFGCSRNVRIITQPARDEQTRDGKVKRQMWTKPFAV
jgi:hypothetical protein